MLIRLKLDVHVISTDPFEVELTWKDLREITTFPSINIEYCVYVRNTLMHDKIQDTRTYVLGYPQ